MAPVKLGNTLMVGLIEILTRVQMAPLLLYPAGNLAWLTHSTVKQLTILPQLTFRLNPLLVLVLVLVAVAAWSVAPNLQFYWLVDAITQGHEIPARYLWLVTLYSGVQVVGLLSLSILLFQGREVG